MSWEPRSCKKTCLISQHGKQELRPHRAAVRAIEGHNMSEQLSPPILKCCSSHTRHGFCSPASVGFKMVYPAQTKLTLSAGAAGELGCWIAGLSAQGVFLDCVSNSKHRLEHDNWPSFLLPRMLVTRDAWMDLSALTHTNILALLTLLMELRKRKWKNYPQTY